MASFTDSPQSYQFQSYIPEASSQALFQVGSFKQGQLMQGIQKVQGQVDSLYGLPLAKEETRQYVQGKISELRNSLSQGITGDFSNSQLLNQVGGYAAHIAQDPIVQNGVQSTARAQARHGPDAGR
jgi:hypothetical protein